MAQIKDKFIHDAFEQLDSFDDEKMNAFIEKHLTPQESFVGFLLSSAVEYDNDTLGDYLFYYFNAFLLAIELQEVSIKIISDEMIDAFQDEYGEVLEAYSAEEDEDIIASFCNQPAMLNFLLAELQTEDENGEMLPAETVGQLFVVGVGMIALLNRSMES